ncbi:unnamed protein product [Fraxinus pennsylvanica]|uniref:DUF4228 domain protein n=1 Tax=Fraxinus pennsylvanica TaxID=56036 RepID=A0AAD2EC51_9LAMI|nr:unnamed protein product [Fraxinus pennsylvanica]
MCSCFRSCVSLDSESKRKRESDRENFSFSVSPSIRDISVRIVHAGGLIELYPNAIPASELIQKYPGMCITQPHIFTCPHESVLSADDMLVPGNKYFVVRSSTVEKLKRKYKANRPADTDEPIVDSKETEGVGENFSEYTICAAEDFHVPKDNWSNYFREKCAEKKQFVPPIQKARMWKVDWEPSLNSIKELSP